MSVRHVNLTQINALALAVACGSSVKQFAVSRDIPLSTCYAWAALPRVRALIDRYSNEIAAASIRLAAVELVLQQRREARPRQWPTRSQAELRAALRSSLQKRPAAKEPA